LAPENAWTPLRVLEELRRLHVHHISLDTVEEVLRNPSSSEGVGRFRGGLDPRYLGRGIGTALCRGSVRWAKDHQYAAVIGIGADGPFELTEKTGYLPWTTYSKAGFQSVAKKREETSGIRDRLMVLDLRLQQA
jgi:GNAT superfamily N-acetyltransferase